MAVTMDDVLRVLAPDEPDYPAAAKSLGSEAAPVLAELAGGENVEFASKAASLAGFLEPESARAVVALAVVHPDPSVRVAGAAAMQDKPTLVRDLAAQLLTDPDPGVRKWVLRSIGTVREGGLRSGVERIAQDDPLPALRELAGDVARELQ